MSAQYENNYELSNAILQLFDGDKRLPDRKYNACINCQNATWYRSDMGSLSATCSKMNVVVYRREDYSNETATDKRNAVGSIQVCSGNPSFQPEEYK